MKKYPVILNTTTNPNAFSWPFGMLSDCYECLIRLQSGVNEDVKKYKYRKGARKANTKGRLADHLPGSK